MGSRGMPSHVPATTPLQLARDGVSLYFFQFLHFNVRMYVPTVYKCSFLGVFLTSKNTPQNTLDARQFLLNTGQDLASNASN